MAFYKAVVLNKMFWLVTTEVVNILYISKKENLSVFSKTRKHDWY